MVKLTILVNSLFILTHCLFWLIFYLEYMPAKKSALKTSCILAVIGSFAVSFLYLKKLPFVFDMVVSFPLFLMNPYIDALLPFISSIFHLIFVVAFRNSMEPEERRILGKPLLSIIVGISFFVLLHLVVLVNFVTTRKFEWLEHMPRAVAIGTLPLMVAAVFLILIFYFRFYEFLDSGYKTDS